MKKNNTAKKTIQNAEKLTAALKEGTEKTLRSLINETITNLITEDEDMEETEEDVVDDDNSFEVEDVDVNDEETTDEPQDDETEDVEEPEEEVEDEWSEFDDYKTDDNDYDFTGEDEDASEKLLKLFSLMDDGDQVIVKKDGETLEVSNEDGTETVIDIDSDDNMDAVDDDIEADDEEEDDEFEFEIDDEDDELDTDSEDVEDFEEPATDDEEEEEDDDEFEFEIDDEDDELDESTDLGYTTNYQKQSAMTTPPNKEVANPNDTYSMDDVPEGDSKRWAGKGDSKPFGKQACCENEEMTDDVELEEATNVGGAVQQRSTAKSHIPAGRKNYVPKGTRHASFGAEYNEIVETVKAIKKENDELKECIKNVKQSLKEAAVLNVNMGKVIKLLSEETTTQQEKKSILERFNSVKTINEGATLYENIKRELNETKRPSVTIERTLTVESKEKNLNETTIYNSKSNPSIALMNRMERLDEMFKKK